MEISNDELRETKKGYKIGETALLAGVNKETIRYYERRKLIPEPDRRKSGYRIFSKRHISQIRFIKRAQELGFTLSEIKGLLELRLKDNTSCSAVRKEAMKKYNEIERKIIDLQEINDSLMKLIDLCDENKITFVCPILETLEGNENIINF